MRSFLANSVLLLALVSDLTASTAACAERYALPAKTGLSGGSVVVEFEDADVTVVIDEGVEPTLSVDAPRETGKAVFAEAVRGADGLRVAAVDEEVRLAIELRLRPDQHFALRGNRLAVQVSVASREPAESDEPAGSGDGVEREHRLEIRLTASELDLEGADTARVEATDSQVWIRDGWGSLALDLRGGTATVRRQIGNMTLQASGVELDVLDCESRLVAELVGGDLLVDGGSGGLTVTSRGTDLTLTGWSGDLNLTGETGRFEARDVGGVSTAWVVEGTDLEATLERFDGSLRAQLSGSSLDVRELTGSLVVTGSSAVEVMATDIGSSATLRLDRGSSARVAKVGKLLQAVLEDSSLEVERTRSLELTATRSDVRLAGVEYLQKLEAADSSLTADLSEIARNPHLDLRGAGDATIWLSTPCVVTVRTDDPDRAGQVRVTSCDLRMPGQPLHSARNRLIHGHRVPVVLSLSLGDDVTVVAEGRTTE